MNLFRHRSFFFSGPILLKRCLAAGTTATPDIRPVVQEEATDEPAVKPLIFDRQLLHTENLNLRITEVKDVWVDNFENPDTNDKRGLVQVHPLIFNSYPRVDLIHKNIVWQQYYRKVDWTSMHTREELFPMGPRPWPQKGTGRARHKDKRSPIWHCGGWSHPPRGPLTFFYMLPYEQRVGGLTAALTCKLAQNDLIIVDTLDNFPFTEPKDLEAFLERRRIGPSTLIVDSSDLFPKNIALASEAVSYVTLMPVYGLNVYSMMKHETLILTVSALELIEEKLLVALKRTDLEKLNKKYEPPIVGKDRDPMLELPTQDYIYPAPEMFTEQVKFDCPRPEIEAE